jgi:hypothetical protein
MQDGQISNAQQQTCRRYGVEPLAAPDDLKVGIALDVRGELRPINGLRHPPEGDTTGWYIWAGEIDPAGQGEDFFVPLHVSHVSEWCPGVVPYLALPAGWRFLLAPNYEDVWYDESLLAVDDQ